MYERERKLMLKQNYDVTSVRVFLGTSPKLIKVSGMKVVQKKNRLRR